MSASTSTSAAAGQLTRSTNNARKKPMPRVEIQRFLREVVTQCYPKLEPNPIWFPLEGEAREKYGDYGFFGVIDICDKSRRKDPDFFYKKGPIAVAQKIVERVEYKNFDMIQTMDLHAAGILTFRLEGSWIATRINNMLSDGIDTWAPTIYHQKRGKAVFIMPQYERLGWDMVRAIYIKDALVNLFMFSGADVGNEFSDDKTAELAVQKHFIESPEGEIYSERHHTSLVARPPQYVLKDLATLWYGIKSQKADVMVYMTPHRLRGYTEKCHIAAAKEGWLPHNWEDLGTLTCCGFQTFSREQEEMRDLFGRFTSTGLTPELHVKFRRLGIDFGDFGDSFFECAFKFMCLKSHRLAECIFRFEDIFDEGNTLASLLETRTLVRSLLKNSPRINLKLKALARKERELGLHLIEFTRVIERSCTVLAPHLLCEYLCNLCTLFMCCYREPGENMLGLCQATDVVMNKCFQLLGIAPSKNERTKDFEHLIFCGSPLDAKYCITEDARDEHPNSRLEMLSMFVSVKHSQFEEGYLSGSVTVVDKGRSANGDGWVLLDKNDDCHISVFDREWYNAESFLNGSYIPLGDTSSVHSIPFSSSIEVELLIKATSQNSDQTYLICNDNGKANLADFWEEDLNTKCGTFEFDRADGRILLDFVAIKEAVDTRMELTFNQRKDSPVRLSGLIKASYGKDVLGESGFLGQYTAHIFRADPGTEYIWREEPHLLRLYKSAMAVPANGCLCMHAYLVDADTQECIVDEKKNLCESIDGVSTWAFDCGVGSFELRVNWVHHKARRGSSQVQVY